MLGPLTKLMIAALVSIHQYIPNEDAQYTKYYNDVRQAQAENILPAAHQSCRYLISVFVGAGLDSTFGGDHQGSKLSQTFVDVFAGDQTFKWAMSLMDKPKYQKKLARYGMKSSEIKKIIMSLCQKDFKPFVFTESQKQEIMDFIHSEVEVLSKSQMQSMGEYKYFGSVELLDRSAQQIGTIDSVPRHWVPYHKISKNLVLALLATEDEDFLSHKGVDTKAIARIAKQILSDNRATGGSTVTMQVLKNMFFKHGPESSYDVLNQGEASILLRKVREWYWAWPFEKTNARTLGDLSAKEYVIELYFNLVGFGPRIQGIAQASQVYFGKQAKDLSLGESAFITSLLKAPTRYSNQDNYVEDTKPRRDNYVIQRMKDIGFISEEQYAQAISEDLPVWKRPSSQQVHSSSVYVKNHTKSWLDNYNFPSRPQAKDIIVETTIDKDLQKTVYDVVKKNLDKQDEVRDRLNAVGPARDDRGRTARIRHQDFGDIYNSKLQAIKAVLDKTTGEYDIGIYLGKAAKKKLYYHTNEDLMRPERKQYKQINSILNSRNLDIGDIVLIRLLDKNLQQIKNPEKIQFKDEISLKEVASLNKKLAALLQKIKKDKFNLAINALNRMDWAKPRADMVAAVYLENRSGLYHKNNFKVKLTSKHQRFFDRKVRSHKFEDGEIFWLTDTNSPSSQNPKKQEDIETKTSNRGGTGEDVSSSGVKRPETLTYELDAPKLQAAVLIMNSNTGEVLANFGGYDPNTSSFDRSRFAMRQPGSSIKPWIYFFALNKGLNPQDILNNTNVSFKIDKNKYYRPKNYSAGVGGHLALYKALTKSQNIAALSLLQNPNWGPVWQDNLNELRSYLNSVGIYKEPINSPTIVLGAQGLAVETLVGSYTYFANGEHIVKPQYFKHLSDRKGNVYYNGEVQTKEVPKLKDSTTFQIRSLLLEVGNTGTAASLRNFLKNLDEGAYKDLCFNNVLGANKQACLGGKTGTSDSSKDTWFMGFSKNFVIGVWVGYDYPRPLGYGATGSSVALPIFKGIIEKGLKDLPPIEPVLSMEDKPRDLERRSVFGNKACISGRAQDEYIIYTDYRSPRNTSCSTHPNQVAAVCKCRKELYGRNDYDYYLDVTYQGKTYKSLKKFETQGTERDKRNCEISIRHVKNSEGRLICNR